MAEKLRYEITAKDKSKAALRSVKGSLQATTKAANLLRGALGGLALGLAAKRLATFTKRSIEAADALAKTADKVGVSVRALQELRFAADLAGVSQEKLDSSVERFTKRVGEAAQGTGEALKALKALGVEFEIGGKIQPTEIILRDVADAMASIESPARQAAIAAQLFGREGVALVNLLKTGSAGLDEFSTLAAKSGAILETRFARGAEVLNDRLTVANRSLAVAKTRIGVAFGQAGLVDTFADALNDLSRVLSKPAVARQFVRAIQNVNKVLKLLIHNFEQISLGIAVIFGTAVLLKIARFAVAILKMGRAVASTAAVIGLARFLVSKLGLAIAATVTIAGVLIDRTTEAKEAIQRFTADLGIGETVIGLFQRALDSAGLSSKSYAADVFELTRAADEQRDIFVAARFSLGDVERATDSYAESISKAATETEQLNAITKNAFGQGALIGARDYFQGLKDTSAQATEFDKNSFQSLEQALSDFFVSGKLDFQGFIDTVKRGLADIAAKGIVSFAGSLATGALETIGGSVGSRIVRFLGLAEGGYLTGPGGDRSDNIPALLSPGEYVISAPAVRAHGKGFFDKLNYGGGGAGASPLGDMIPGFGFGGFLKRIFKSVTKVIKKVAGFVVSTIKGTIKGLTSGDPLAIASIVGSFILPGVGTAIGAALGAPSAGAAAAAAVGLGSSAIPGIAGTLGVRGVAGAISTGISNSFAQGILGGQLSASAIGKSLVSGAFSKAATSAVSQAFGGIGAGGFDSLSVLGFVQDKAGVFAKAIETSLGRLLNTAEPFMDSRANGGPVSAGQPYVVGEAGPELMVPGAAGAVTPNGSVSVVAAVLQVRDEVADLRRQFGMALSGGALVGAR